MSAAIGTKNNIGTRVERREKPSDSLTPYLKLLAVKHEVVRRLELLRRRWR